MNQRPEPIRQSQAHILYENELEALIYIYIYIYILGSLVVKNENNTEKKTDTRKTKYFQVTSREEAWPSSLSAGLAIQTPRVQIPL